MNDELGILAPAEHTLTLGGQAVTIRPFRIGQVPRLVQALRHLAPAIHQAIELIGQAESAVAEEDAETRAAADMLFMERVADLIVEHGDSLIRAVAIAVDFSENAIRELDLAEFVGLISTVIRLNRDFFAQRLGPALQGARVAVTSTATTH